MPSRALFLFLALVFATTSSAKTTVPDDRRVDGAKYILGATMATSDGVTLVMDIILPPGPGPFPVMLWRSPYNKEGVTAGEGRKFVEAGYAVVAQDTRGRTDSEGDWYPFKHESRDGAETQAWVASQPWCDGRIGLAGGSYLGFTQTISGPVAPDAVKAMIPEVPWGNTYRDVLYWGGVFQLQLGFFWGGSQYLADVGKPMPDMTGKDLFGELPLLVWDNKILGDNVAYLDDWIRHPTEDEYWDSVKIGSGVHEIRAAALYIGGWYDIFATGVLNLWSDVRRNAKTGEAANSQFLVIGPWGHGGPQKEGKTGALDFGKVSFVDKNSMRMAFLDEYVRGNAGAFSSKQPPLMYFVMGSNRWKSAHEWPLSEVEYRPLFLSGSGSTLTPSESASLLWTAPSGPKESDTFTYDPANPTPTNGGQLLWPTAGPQDQTAVEARSDVLVYSTDILTETVEVTGPVKLILYASTSAVDTDFTGKLIDVYPGADGKEVPYNLTDGILRARFRDSEKGIRLIEPGRVYSYEIDLGVTSNAFLPGHRIRVEIASSNFPRFDRNLNTGQEVGTTSEMVPAQQAIYRGRGFASRLILPVVPD